MSSTRRSGDGYCCPCGECADCVRETLKELKAARARIKRLESAIYDLLQMHEEWNANFDGFAAVNRAERLLKLPISKTK